MNGGLTVEEMAERKEAVAFLEWLKQVSPATLELWLATYAGEFRTTALRRFF